MSDAYRGSTLSVFFHVSLAGYKNVCACDHMTCSRQKGIFSPLVKIDNEKTVPKRPSWTGTPVLFYRNVLLWMETQRRISSFFRLSTYENFVLFPHLCTVLQQHESKVPEYAHRGLSSIRIASSLSDT